MANPNFYTRIQLKYDKLSEWISKDPALLKGEIAIVEVPSVSSDAPEVNPPSLLMKIGEDGVKKFSELPWLSAKAADVYSWAKKDEDGLEGFGKWLSEKEFSWTPAGAETPVKFKVASKAELDALAGRVSDLESRATTLETTVNETHANRLKTLEDLVGLGGDGEEGESISEKVIALEGYVGVPAKDGAAATGLHAAVTAAQDQADKGVADAAKAQGAAEGAQSTANEAKELAEANEDKLVGITTTVTAAIEAAKGEAATDAATKAGTAKAEAISESKTYTDEEIDKVEETIGDINDSISGINTTLESSIKSVVLGEDGLSLAVTNNKNDVVNYTIKDTTYSVATTSALGLVKSGSEVSVGSDGVMTVEGLAGLKTTVAGHTSDISGINAKLDVEKVSTAISTAVSAETTRATEAEEDLGERIDGVEAKLGTGFSTEKTVAGEITRVEGLVSSSESAAAAKYATIAALEAETKTRTDADSAFETRVKANEDKLAGLAEATVVAEINAKVKALADGQVATNKTDIATLSGDLTGYKTTVSNTYATKAELSPVKTAQEANTTKLADITGTVGATIDTKVKALEDGAVKANADAIVTEKQRAEAIEADHKKRIETMEAFWEAAQADGTDSNVIDTLKEIQEYIASDESGASEMAASIKQNTDAIALLNDSANKAGSVAYAVKAEETRALAAESALSTKIDNLRIDEIKTNSVNEDGSINYVVFNCGSASECI